MCPNHEHTCSWRCACERTQSSGGASAGDREPEQGGEYRGQACNVVPAQPSEAQACPRPAVGGWCLLARARPMRMGRGEGEGRRALLRALLSSARWRMQLTRALRAPPALPCATGARAALCAFAEVVFLFSFAARTCVCSLVVATFAVARHDKVGLVLARTHLSFPPRVHIRDSQADADLQWAAYALIPDPRSPITKLYSEAEDLQQMALVTHKMFEGTCSLVLIMVQASSSCRPAVAF